MKQAVLLLFILVSALAHAQEKGRPKVRIPAEIRPFVEEGTRPIALHRADLNGDGYLDYVLVLERQRSEDQESDREEGQRPLLLIVRKPSQELKLAKRNEKIILCSTCGGDMGDPLESIEVGLEKFSVRHRSRDGSSVFEFEYVRRDDTWQLTKSEQVRLHSRDPRRAPKRVVHTAPMHFGMLDIVDFDPDVYLNAEAK